MQTSKASSWRNLTWAFGLAATAGLAAAQATTTEPSPPASPPASAPVPGPAPAPAPAPAPTPQPAPATPSATQQRIEIRGDRINETNERRESTASKIIIGREDIERYGDSTTTEVLKRLPGVTIGGAPGRGGPPRMRGMGAGFTQLLLNGERVPPGFSLDSISPEQIERIEVLRAPTAETGARAIAGTINIVTREGFRKRINDLKVGFNLDRGRLAPGLFFTRNDSLGPSVIYTLSLALFNPRTERSSDSTTELLNVNTGDALTRYSDASQTVSRSKGLNLNARTQFRFGEGHSLVLMPMVIVNRPNTLGEGTRERTLCTPTPGVLSCAPTFATSTTTTTGQFNMLRLNTQYNRQTPDGTRLELRANGGQNRWDSLTLRRELDTSNTLITDAAFDAAWRDRNVNLGAKATKLLADNHNVVAGVEDELNTRLESRTTLVNGSVPEVLDTFGEDLNASVRRQAAYIQDEWNINPQWGAHAGLRWEAIRTRGSGALGAQTVNRSSVVTPLAHMVYKLDAKKRDQVRLSLTRSYRTPTLAQLIARPNFSLNNTPTSPDRYGNPNLRPELATGVDMAFERYLDEGGVLSANLFHRKLTDVIRNVATVNDANGRTESRPENFGNGSTTGLELEAKFRLDQLVTGAPSVDLRWNGSVFGSKVDAVPGPNNRLEQQARGVMNTGFDYRFRGTPLAVGGSVNWTPSVTTQLTATQSVRESSKVVGDVYGTWTFDPNLLLRVSASNVAPRDYTTTNTIRFGSYGQTSVNQDHTSTALNVRLEIKL
jgi:outer membrane receptor for ferrienterochelin and colicins